MLRQIYKIIILIIYTNVIVINATKCNRQPEGYGANKTPADGRFHIRIAEPTLRYKPGSTYTISVEGIETSVARPIRHKFSGFMITVEQKTNQTIFLSDYSNMSFGVFALIPGDTMSKITCANMVTHTTTTPKSEIRVLWTAPPPGSGCVIFRATVIEHRDIWYMDDGPLSKEFCEDEQATEELQSLQLEKCCACAEAKYELAVEGLWSRNTHPKDFPSNNWLTRFSDIIGATHTLDYRFWQYGDSASDGLRQVAEHGATRMLEQELKGQSTNIRTIIKARGLSYPNITGRTFAVFRVDPNHHLVSFVSMIDPSPDWFVGVSGLELCLPNCSWIENKVLDLYPWDAGTDSGPTYISPDQPTNPQDPIRRIRPNYPNDPRSPFYDPDSDQMRPLARLHLQRQRLYEKSCSHEESDGEGGGGSEAGKKNTACLTTKWGTWSNCTDKCTKTLRYRQREFINKALAIAENCNDTLTQKKDCVFNEKECLVYARYDDEQIDIPEPECALSPFSSWSECPERCGEFTQYRSRHYAHRMGSKHCRGRYNFPLEETRECPNLCMGNIETEQEGNPTDSQPDNDDGDRNCQNGKWSDWSQCSATCGGIKTRWRVPIDTERCGDERVYDSKKCGQKECKVPGYCLLPPVQGSCRNATLKYYYNKATDSCEEFQQSCSRSRNKFASIEECEERCRPGKNNDRSERSAHRTSTEKGLFGWISG